MWGPLGMSWAYAGLLGAMFGALGKHATFHALSEYPRCALKSVKYEAETIRDSPEWSLRCVSAACSVVGEWGFFEPACGGGAINRLYTPCTRKGRGKFDRYAQSAEAKK